jgi:hypothetical protein
MISYLKKFWHKASVWAFGSLIGFVFIVNPWLTHYQASISPEFIGRIPIKILYLAIAAIVSIQTDKWICPTIDKYTSQQVVAGRTQFELDFESGDDKRMIRPAIALAYYTTIFSVVFIGLCL